MACLAFPFACLLAGVGLWTYLAQRLAAKSYSFQGPVYSVRGPWARRAGLVMMAPLPISLICGLTQAVLFLTESDPGWVGFTLLILQMVILLVCGMTISWIWFTKQTGENDNPRGEDPTYLR